MYFDEFGCVFMHAYAMIDASSEMMQEYSIPSSREHIKVLHA
jgi:hypothetical protein